MARTGRDALLEVLRSEGVRHIFGNPGSTELPLMDALATADDLHYVLALQEATAVGMADGYAQATGRPAFLNLHTSAGFGNAIGNLTNAQANRTPLVVTAGQQDDRHIVADPLLSGDLVGLAAPVSKWAHEVRSLGELGTIVRRAFHDATAPPPGPVFVSMPMSTLDEEGEAPVPAPSTIERRAVAASLDELAALLTEPAVGRLAIVVGDEVERVRRGRPLSPAWPRRSAPRCTPARCTPPASSPPPIRCGRACSSRRRAPSGPRWRPTSGCSSSAAGPSWSTRTPTARRCPTAPTWCTSPPTPRRSGAPTPCRLGVAGDPALTLDALLPLVRAKADAVGRH